MAGMTGHKSYTYTVADNLATNVAALLVLGANGGVSISGAEAVTAVLAAESTRTLTSGALRCYVYLPVTSSANGEAATYDWVPYNLLDEASVASTVAHRYFPVGDKAALTGVGRIAWLPDGVVVSAGTTVSLTYTTRRRK